ncbi:ABC transporter ATP-binding protein [Cellulomonas dongxiuzhuiae]|uniref:ABC transporter ATP-binding protein n=1 Tax=Cellulomonas dongxiuzhuiae TaxID=2819979 RepID=A0ABX8GJ35_9CELL|nr:ABC transporter ATP-binding protein [Cellulomonas dongxiuzhuiae]MBO3089200.1 ABC transporter ATP-binding protein [Cellulomonas dongxiuzhuiae]MBO3095019.1 ABC transporter ATP-binding protein [Cellulomonas dongxiuzhuiae]QWC16035.1 ABC transporter ATP-binding protein [Cellulomonas dongxiuzhuiae]
MTTSTSPYIEVKDLAVSYDGQRLAVSDVDLEVGPSEFVAVLGPSGCGKSTLLQVLSGLLAPAAGTATIAGRDVTSTAGAAPRIGYVFQDHRLLPWRTVAQNLEIVLSAAGVPRDQWPERIDRYLRMLRVEAHRDAWPLRLSGGQRQRVSIARALAIDPAVVLMDEPFSTLDEVTARQMRQQLGDLFALRPTPVLFVTHSVREAVFLADRILILTPGPARVLETVTVDVPRPRAYEDATLAAIEAAIVARVVDLWTDVPAEASA